MSHYYQASAYRSDNIPAQPYPQQNWDSLLRTHLPWGHTEDVYYDHYYPQALRNDEKLFQDIASGKDKNPIDYSKFHFRYDHEVFRYAKAAWITQALIFIRMFAMVGSILLPIATFFVYFIYLYITDEDGTIIERTVVFLPVIYAFVFLPISIWLLCYSIMRWLPGHWWLRANKRAAWEFNRRTGIVTTYQRKQKFIAPFCEWDAYVNSTPDRSGFMTYSLHLAHRYQKISFSVSGLVPMGYDPELHYAYWDFLQNYMDTSKPLPDMPTFEPYRHLDPVTAAFDQATNRNPRYWVDMDDATWKQAKMAMANKIKAINPFRRSDIMPAHYSHDITQDQGHFERY